ncbi:MAG: hypothetical protein D6698_12295 [Gammaproteobacteria bacterium]|nr:MAG: hypothetical protein D6698_12295 [Gammaproteobacteria bacterium]
MALERTARGELVNVDEIIERARMKQAGGTQEIHSHAKPDANPDLSKVKGFIPTPRSMVDMTAVTVGGSKRTKAKTTKKESPKEKTTKNKTIDGIDEILDDMT